MVIILQTLTTAPLAFLLGIKIDEFRIWLLCIVIPIQNGISCYVDSYHNRIWFDLLLLNTSGLYIISFVLLLWHNKNDIYLIWYSFNSLTPVIFQLIIQDSSLPSQPAMGCLLGVFWKNKKWPCYNSIKLYALPNSGLIAPSQWEMALLCNGVSHWLGAILESALKFYLLQPTRYLRSFPPWFIASFQESTVIYWSGYISSTGTFGC